MLKKTLVKTGGFAAAAAATAALVGFAAHGTGAYFTDSKSGNVNIATGHVTVNTTDISGLDFSGLLPGDYKTVNFQYNVNTGTAPEDVYLELDNVPAFQDAPGAPTSPTPLGRYGHLAVSGPDGSFSSFNLAADVNHGTATADPTDCVVDDYGRGGNQTTEATSTTDFHNGFCPAPKFILLSYGMDPSATNATASITFGFTGLLTGPQGQAVPSIPFKVVAVQHGILPGNPNNGGL
jgi:hypothetical protein